MLEIKNLRTEKWGGGYSRLVADISSDIKRTDTEDTIWISVSDEHSEILNSENYDSFLMQPLYMAMYYHTDLRIHGTVSKELFRNVQDHLIPILCSFSDKLTPINIYVDGFSECGEGQSIIGTGISCGVDSLATVYKYFENESDSDYRINTLFMLNCGWHGKYGDQKTIDVFKERCAQNKKAADELGLSFIEVDSNLHAFLPHLGDQASYFALYSVVFALEKGIKKYYLSSSYSYEEIMRTGYRSRNRDFSEYGDAIALPLLRTSRCEIISDGCQQSRSQKTEMISDWEISKKYLNVCCINDSEENCSRCHKCVRTMIPLYALGKLENYSDVFDLKTWDEIKKDEFCQMVIDSRISEFAKDNYDFCIKQGLEIPSLLQARLHFAPKYIKRVFNGFYFKKFAKKLFH